MSNFHESIVYNILFNMNIAGSPEAFGNAFSVFVKASPIYGEI